MTVHLAPSSPRCSGHFRLAGRSLWDGGWFPGGAWVTPVPRLTHKACLLFPLRAGFVRMARLPSRRRCAALVAPDCRPAGASTRLLCRGQGGGKNHHPSVLRGGCGMSDVGSWPGLAPWEGGGESLVPGRRCPCAPWALVAGVTRSQGVMRSQTQDQTRSLRAGRAASNRQKPSRTSRVQPKNPRLRSLRTWV